MTVELFSSVALPDGLSGVVVELLGAEGAYIVEVFKGIGSVGEGIVVMEPDSSGVLQVCDSSREELDRIRRDPPTLLADVLTPYELGTEDQGG